MTTTKTRAVVLPRLVLVDCRSALHLVRDDSTLRTTIARLEKSEEPFLKSVAGGTYFRFLGDGETKQVLFPSVLGSPPLVIEEQG